MSKINSIHHYQLKCKGYTEFQRTVAFYRDVLGIPVARTWGEGDGSGIMLDTGAGIVEIFANAEDSLPKGCIRHIALGTDDPDTFVNAARDAGYTVTVEPQDIAIPSDPPYRARIAFIIGPVGEEIELFSVK